MTMHLPRRLVLRIGGAMAAAFVLAMGVTWSLHYVLAEKDAYRLMDRVLNDVQGEIEEQANRRLLLAAMHVRDRLPGLPDRTSPTLKALAAELRVDEICLADTNGLLVASSEPSYVGFDFRKMGGQAAAFLVLLDEQTELAQPLMPNANGGDLRKYVGVWLPEGGFVQVGCTAPTLNRLAQAAITGLTHNRHVGGVGTVVITTEQGQIISDARESGLEGAVMQPPADDVYCVRRVIEGFPVYALLPKKAAAIERHMLVGTSALLTVLSLVFVAVLVGIVIARFVREQIERQNAAELDMAKGIQLSALPNAFPAYPHELRMEVFARMDTAKEVGGDFYDFYHVGPDRIAYLIADVSGKGVPAAMFMMKAKAVIKACTQSKAGLADALTEANARLCENNDRNMFVTCWIGVLNLKSGLLEYVNCGHNPPYIRRPDGSLEALRKVSGLFLGGMEGVRYRKFETRMEPGDLLYLFTDGVTEAVDASNELFGEARLQPVLAQGGRPEEVCRRVKEAVDAFAGPTPQFDDITMLALRYRGEPVRSSRTFPAKLESLGEVAAFVESRLEESGCPAKIRAEMLVAVDEIGNNIASYSGSPDMEVVFERAEEPPVVRLTFIDAGTPWDPLAHLDPDTTLGLDERAVGGLGILMVKKLMDDVRYERRGDHNVLALRKSLPVEGGAA